MVEGKHSTFGSRIVDFFTASVARTVGLALLALVAFLAVIFVLGEALLGFGPQTMWVNLHYAAFILLLFAVMFLLDLVYLPRTASPQLTRGMKIAGILLFVTILLVVVLGIIPDIPFDTAHVAGSYNSPYGTIQSNITDAGVANFTGPLIFDMMEHTSLIVPGIFGVTAVLINHYGERVVSDPRLKQVVLSLIALGAAWTLVLAVMGVVMVKTLTFPPGV